MSRIHTLTVFAALSAFAVVLSAVSPADAATLNINGIAPFDTNLGTLTSVKITIDPIQQNTQSYTTQFDNISNHSHLFNPLATSIPGLGVFNYAPVFTSVGGSAPFGTHDHTVNVFATFNVYNGPDLAWFLNAGNPTINSVTFPPQNTAPNEDHTHTVLLLPAVPHTVFTYDPVPEPASLALFGLGSTLFMRRRR